MCIVCLNEMALRGDISNLANVDANATASAALNGQGYVLNTSGRLNVLKWGDDEFGSDGGRVTWSLSLAGINFTSTRTQELYIDAAQAAFDAWESVAAIDFEYVEGDADIDVQTATEAEVPQLSGSTVGFWTTSIRGGDDNSNDIGIMSNANIYMDLAPNWSPFGVGGLSYYAVLLHEIGHAIGLDHIVDNTQIMNSSVRATDLGVGDIAGARAIYGDARFSDEDDLVSFASESTGQFANLGAGNDNLTGSAFADRVSGGAGDDIVNAGAGRDVLIDALGLNSLNGEEGDDFIFSSGDTSGTRGGANGGSGRDIVLGGAGDDRLAGGIGDDTIVGDATNGFFHGDDHLTAGSGTDFLEGGGGRDIFVFRPNEGTNTIAELSFNASNPAATRAIGEDFTSGVDQIQLIGFGLSRSQAFNAVTDVNGTAEFAANGTTIVFYDMIKADLDAGDFFV